jgi:TPR repeat protein
MRKLIATACVIAAALVVPADRAGAGPWEDGMAAYNRGDYVPAMQLVRPLAQGGNAKAQALLGMMYRRGEGVAKNSARAFMWLSRAAHRGDREAQVQLKGMSKTMTPEEMAVARAMMRACEASNYRDCGY